jgi:uncharacterized protein YjdB
LALAALAGLAPPAAAVQITAGSGSGLPGTTVDITISTTDLTGLGVYAFQFSMSFTASRLTVVDVLEAGTLTAGWGDATFHPGSGTVSVSHAGVTALSGSGPLLTLRFQLDPAAPNSNNTLTWQSFLFNEGAPNDTTSNGNILILPMPVITVSPNTAEVVRNETLLFSVSGSVTPPVTWGTTDAAIASIAGTGLLTGLAPGAVRVFAVDNAGLRDTTDSQVFVRGMRVTVGATSAYLGAPGSVPVTVTDLSGLGIRAGQLKVDFAPSRVTPTGVTTTGTMLDGYGSVDFGVVGSTLIVDFAGTTDLNGSGTLCHLNFDASPTSPGGSTLVLSQALFNETLPAVRVNGSFTVLAFPTITVSPENVTLLAGQTQLFTVSGSPTPPITWSTLDPTIASIDPTGLLTALSGGVTKVQAVDNVGATDQNTAVTVYDFRVWPDTVQVAPGDTALVPILIDRNVDALDIYSLQYKLNFSPTYLTGVSADGSGLMGAWGTPASNPLTGQLVVAGAGSVALGAGLTVHRVRIAVSPSAPYPTNVPLTLTDFLCNEGLPKAQVAAGRIEIREPVVGVAPGALAFALSPVWPNPSREVARFAFTIPESPAAGGRMRLAVYGVDGRLVRTLLDGPTAAGPHELVWDLRDAGGRRVGPGIFLARLEWAGESLVRKFAAVR